jgi:hypothetical protein
LATATKQLKNFGFALLVLIGLVVAGYLAVNCRVPDPLPDFALRAEEVYRVEIGAACFIAFYLAATAFVLALNGRGFTDVGPGGVKANEFVNRELDQEQQVSIDKQAEADRAMLTGIGELHRVVRSLGGAVGSIEERLKKVEEEGDPAP